QNISFTNFKHLKLFCMRKLLTAIMLPLLFAVPACDLININTIQGNGHVATETRSISEASNIESHGSFDVQLVQGSTPSLKVEADDNLIPYIITENVDGKLIIRTKEHTGLRSDNKIK